MTARWLSFALLLTGCSLVYDYPQGSKSESGPVCHDGRDNDYDGQIDCQDPDCAGECNEALHCADGVDNDGDRLVDCADPDCRTTCSSEERGQAACSNGQDDDEDGLVDCVDPDCDGFCTENDGPSCGDSRDNDGDGLTDQSDPGCWPYRVGAPEVMSCDASPPLDFVDEFSVTLANAPWWKAYGNPWSEVGKGLHGVNFPATLLDFGSFEPGALVSAALFVGNTDQLELSVVAQVFRGRLIVALAPPDVATLDGLKPGFEGSGLALVANVETGLELTYQGLPVVSLPGPLPPGEDRFTQYTVTQTGDQVAIKFRDLTAKTEKNAVGTLQPRDLTGRLLVAAFGSGQKVGDKASHVQSIGLHLAGKTGCPYSVPQIPFIAPAWCALPSPTSRVEFTGAVAAGHDGSAFCSLLEGSDLGDRTSTRLEAWTSGDEGATWARAGEIRTAGTFYRAGGVARDPVSRAWRSVIRAESGDQLEYALWTSPDCATWTRGASLDPGTSSNLGTPSLVQWEDGAAEVYFAETTPKAVILHRGTLEHDRLSAVNQVAELPAELREPVSVAPVSRNDLSLVAPRSAEAGGSLALLLATRSDPTQWLQSGRWPLLDHGPDSSQALAGTLVSSSYGPWLVFSSMGAFSGRGLLATTDEYAVAALPLDVPSPDSEPRPDTCGDGECNSGESCSLDATSLVVGTKYCDLDCCQAEVFDTSAQTRWPGTVDLEYFRRSAPFHSDQRVLAQGQGTGLGWAMHALPEPILGDFDLSFDLAWKASRNAGVCELRVGLGTPSPASADEGNEDDPNISDGVFAAIRTNDFSYAKHCRGLFLGPAARSGEKQWLSRGGDCDPKPVRGGSTHIVLRRHGSEVKMDWTSDDGCYVGSQSVQTGSVGPLSHMLVGVDSLWSISEKAYIGECGEQEVTVDNLVLRRVGCENDACHDGACAVGLDGPDRCGACFGACFPGEVCQGGQCTCPAPATSCSTGCENLTRSSTNCCVDLTRDSMNCGECGRVCEACFLGTCPTVPPSCTDPFRISGPVEDLVLTFPSDWPVFGDGVVLEWTPDRTGTVRIGADDWFEPPYVPVDQFFTYSVPAASDCASVKASIPQAELDEMMSTYTRTVEAGVPILVAVYGGETNGRQLRMHLNFTYQTSP